MSSPARSAVLPYHLGCPVWACPEWPGVLFSAKAPRSAWLRQYSSAFNTVEGNSTFYGLPSLDTVKRWADDAAPGFRFALKFPQAISHEKALVGAEAETDDFLAILEVLATADRLGPSFLQLGPIFDGRGFDALAKYLGGLPREFPYAVEVRHRHWFDEKKHEPALDRLLAEHGVDRCLFDSRPLYSKPPADEWEAESQRRKPKSPPRRTVTGAKPMLRLVGRNTVDETIPWIDEWAPVVAGWIADGLTPYVFLHAPRDLFAPELCDLFHAALRRHVSDLPELPPRPAAIETTRRPAQRMLF